MAETRFEHLGFGSKLLQPCSESVLEDLPSFWVIQAQNPELPTPRPRTQNYQLPGPEPVTSSAFDCLEVKLQGHELTPLG